MSCIDAIAMFDMLPVFFMVHVVRVLFVLCMRPVAMRCSTEACVNGCRGIIAPCNPVAALIATSEALWIT